MLPPFQQLYTYLQDLDLEVSHAEEIDWETPREENHVIFVPTGYGTLPGFGPDAVFLDEDLWVHKQHICQSRLLSLSGKTVRIHGRETTVKRVNKPQYDAFLNENHLLGATSAKRKYGLFHRDQLVAVGGCSLPRRIPLNGREVRSVELNRFCPLASHTVVGGLSKLIKAFIEDLQPDDIMTYIDRMCPVGSGYFELGFQEESRTPPSFLWYDSVTGQRIWPGKVEEHEDTSSWTKIWNRGNLKLRYTLHENA